MVARGVELQANQSVQVVCNVQLLFVLKCCFMSNSFKGHAVPAPVIQRFLEDVASSVLRVCCDHWRCQEIARVCYASTWRSCSEVHCRKPPYKARIPRCSDTNSQRFDIVVRAEMSLEVALSHLLVLFYTYMFFFCRVHQAEVCKPVSTSAVIFCVQPTVAPLRRTSPD